MQRAELTVLDMHADALQLLAEVRDYLYRLPVVPATREQARRIDDFLTNPQSAQAWRQAQERRELDETWEAMFFSAVGYPTFAAEVRGTTLVLAGKVVKPLATMQATIGNARDLFPALSLPLRKATTTDLAIRLLPQ
jgi:hypothetical protein